MKHPLCQICEGEGYSRMATEVHHVTPCETAVNDTDMERLMFDANNLTALCHNCHVRIHTEMGRSGKKQAQRVHEEQKRAAIEKLFGKIEEGGGLF